MPLGLPVSENPAAVRPFYSSFDWLEGQVPSLAAGTTDCLPAPPAFLQPMFPFLLGAACWARPEADYVYPTLVGYQRCVIFLSFMYTLLYPGPHNEN
jgi:hypothetical protein